VSVTDLQRSNQATVVVCLLILLKNGKVQKQVQTFGTTTRELLGLRAWMLSEGCTHTDVKDAKWIADLLCHGLLRSSFVPPPSIRELRDLTRYRRKLAEARQQSATVY
jgi:transposase